MLQQRNHRWVIVDLQGKGGRLRTVPVPVWVNGRIADRTNSAHITRGRVFRELGSRQNLGQAVNDNLGLDLDATGPR